MYLIVSDLHQGLTRKTGVTTESLERFENDKITDLALLLSQHEDKEVIVAGDLFDSHKVSFHSVLQVATVLLNHPKKVWVVAGNHDLSKNTTKMSSLDFLSGWVAMQDTNVKVIFDPTPIGPNHEILLVPHMPNQEIFDEVLASSSGFPILITHCNYENNFTIDKDHSLNLTKAQAKKFKMVISGHEHNKRTVGNVHMVGSFAPCTVGEASVSKCSHVLDEGDLKLTKIITTQQESHLAYGEVHWRELLENASANTDFSFLKVVGEATAAEAPTILSAVAKLRKVASCYMIQNAVVVETLELGDLEGASFDSVNTWELLSGILSDEHKKHLEELGYSLDS